MKYNYLYKTRWNFSLVPSFFPISFSFLLYIPNADVTCSNTSSYFSCINLNITKKLWFPKQGMFFCAFDKICGAWMQDTFSFTSQTLFPKLRFTRKRGEGGIKKIRFSVNAPWPTFLSSNVIILFWLLNLVAYCIFVVVFHDVSKWTLFSLKHLPCLSFLGIGIIFSSSN